MNLTEHFTLEEFIQSTIAKERGIDNTPTDEIIFKLHLTADGLERVRAILGFPIKINSGYRCEALNLAVGGSLNSQHMRGEAVDFTCPGFGSPFQIGKLLASLIQTTHIDQLIMEGTWVHCSFTPSPRQDILTMKNGQYFRGIV